MKNLMIFRNLLFIATLFFVFSCSKKSDEITPASLVGKWKQNGLTGKITYNDNNGKPVTEDLSSAADNSITEFNADGLTVNYLGLNLNYKISGSVITYSGTNGVSFDKTLTKNSATQLTLSFTKDQFYKFLDIIYASKLTDPNYVLFQKIKSTVTVFQYDEIYIKQ
jgi:hypothetical protein